MAKLVVTKKQELQHSKQFKNFKLFTIKEIARRVMKLMENCIGENLAITQKQLFFRIFRTSYDEANLKDWLRWEFTKKAMNYLRRNTKCFVISCRDGNIFYYFVPKTIDENYYYIENLNKSIKAMNIMKARSRKAIKENWYNKKWILPDDMPKKLK